MNRRIFETYVETQLAPTLEKGNVVILDNLSAHKSPVAEQTIRAKGAWILTQSPSASQSDQDHRRPLASNRTNLRFVRAHRMQKLFHRRRIWIHLSVRRSNSMDRWKFALL
jgi:hypothetical protein